MSKACIKVSGVGKRYRLGHSPAGNLSQALAQKWRRLQNTITGAESPDDFWALKDIDFEIPVGQVVGLVGRNGAGKSTLLKVLSRITPPTRGRVEITGRVASLLEVGTGFHPELSGRENIFLNGSILGMRRAEIRSKFDEIVAFAEIERFLDTPVKHYSSGMYVRLAFAVAAHLEPEILIIDEVLAVGDAQFQQKCIAKMESIARDGGRTVLFVTHNMASVLAFCQRCMLFSSGRLVADGGSHEIVKQYLTTKPAQQEAINPERTSIVSVEVEVLNNAEQLKLTVTTHCPHPHFVALEVITLDNARRPIAWSDVGTRNRAERLRLESGVMRLAFMIQSPLMAKGEYYFRLQLMDEEGRREAEFETGNPIIIHPLAKEGEVVVMDQLWNHGSIRLPMTKLST